jgi:hypothetical protein
MRTHSSSRLSLEVCPSAPNCTLHNCAIYPTQATDFCSKGMTTDTEMLPCLPYPVSVWHPPRAEDPGSSPQSDTSLGREDPAIQGRRAAL